MKTHANYSFDAGQHVRFSDDLGSGLAPAQLSGTLFQTMNIGAIKEIRDATPFKPFIIRTADGQGFEVPDHDSLLLAEQVRRSSW